MHIRNFCIIAHIDHGKSTLADRMLELTATHDRKLDHSQALDTMDLEQERGITIKLTPVRMQWKDYELNLIDTPGHVDFQYEVSRSLAAVEGVILLIDASQGIQAQTLSTLYAAMEHDLTIIPVLNKIDLPAADPERRAQEIENVIGIDREEIIAVSAKTGQNVDQVLDAIIERIDSPAAFADNNPNRYTTNQPDGDEIIGVNHSSPTAVSRALIFDSVFDPYKGVVSYVKVVSGSFSRDTNTHLIYSESDIRPTEVGYFTPRYVADQQLSEGQIGYIVTGLKSVREAKVGDTMVAGIKKKKGQSFSNLSIPGFSESKPFVFAGIFPLDTSEYGKLQESIERLSSNDSALSYEYEKSNALGQGFRCGFLGTLHMDIIRERLVREFGMETIFTLPSVTYLIKVRQRKGIEKIESGFNIRELVAGGRHKIIIDSSDYDDAMRQTMLAQAKDFALSVDQSDNELTTLLKSRMVVTSGGSMPDNGLIDEIREPIGNIEIVGPEEFAGAIMTLAQDYRGEMRGMEYLDDQRVLWKYDMPMGEIIIDFYDKLKSATKGYATMNYELKKYHPSDLIRLDIFVNNDRVESLSMIVHRDKAYYTGKQIVEKLKELIPKHLFPIPLQAGIGNKMIARETIPAIRKDVIAKCYGGDITRKRKLLAKQKEGKKKMKALGKVNVPQDIFIKMLQR